MLEHLQQNSQNRANENWGGSWLRRWLRSVVHVLHVRQGFFSLGSQLVARKNQFLITDIGKVKDMLDCIERSECFSVMIPYDIRNFSSIERMILRRTENSDRGSTWQSIADTFRVGSKWALLAPGFATDGYRAALERDEVGLLVRFNKP